MIKMKLRSIVDGKVEGEAIVSPNPISFFGEIDPQSGIVLDAKNPLYGKTIANKIFVFPEGRGSTVGSYVIYGLRKNQASPLALVANKAETIVIAGAILAEITLVDQFEEDVTTVIKNGDIIQIDTEKQILKIREKEK
jgi:predicted aconitase with swiveling domain